MITIRRGKLKDASGTITAGGTSQVAKAAAIDCVYFLIQNISDIDYWVNFDAPATVGGGSIKLIPGSWYENPPHVGPTSAIHILGATTGKAYTIKHATG